MNAEIVKNHIEHYLSKIKKEPVQYEKDTQERNERAVYYQSWTKDKIIEMSEDALLAYFSKLWAMRVWGKKSYVVDKLISDNGFDKLKHELANLIWGAESVDMRWDSFRKQIKGVGPAMMSEFLCHVHPDTCMLWNRRAFVGLRYIGVNDLPRYNYQMTGSRYLELSDIAKDIAKEMQNKGIKDASLLSVDYFIWDELQVEDNLTQIYKKTKKSHGELKVDKIDQRTSEFIHNEVRDKLADIGEWLGFVTKTEIKVADGSKVDTVWEATIGNMGRVIYVFEVQTKGNIDSLIINLLKSLNNPAVQGVVAVSDASQLDKIKKHAAAVQGLADKLKYWDYEQVLTVHENLESVNETINSLGLVPQPF